MSSMLSDHFFININVSLHKQSVSARVISYRKYKSIAKEIFLADFWFSSFVLDTLDDVDHQVDLYDRILRDIVGDHLHIRTKAMPTRPMLAWYNKNITNSTEGIVSGSGSGPVCVFIHSRSVQFKLKIQGNAKSEYYNKTSKHSREIKGLFSVL